MKILRMYYLLPPKVGGMEKHIYYLTKLQSREHEISVFFNYGDKISDQDQKIVPFVKLYKIRPLFIGIAIFYFFILLNVSVKRNKADVIHIHGDWSSLIFANLLKRITKSKLIIFSCHGQITGSFAHRNLLPYFLKKVDLIFSTGFDSADKIEEMSRKKVHIQPSGINEIFFSECPSKIENEKFQVITVANLFPVKNIGFVLSIAKEMPDVVFNIVGDGDQKDMLERQIIFYGLKNVFLLGFKTPKELKSLYHSSDCFLLTSLAEGTPTSALEAMACGLPVISSNAGGLNNIVKEYINGFIIYSFSINQFVDKLRLVKSNLELRKSMFINNVELAKKYKWESVAKNITDKTVHCFDEKK